MKALISSQPPVATQGMFEFVLEDIEEPNICHVCKNTISHPAYTILDATLFISKENKTVFIRIRTTTSYIWTYGYIMSDYVITCCSTPCVDIAQLVGII